MINLNRFLITYKKFIQLMRVALFFAHADLKAKHRRSILGNFWIVMTTGLSILGLSFVWSILTKTPQNEIVPNLCIGLITWQFIANQITSAPSLFIRQTSIIQNIEAPLAYISLHSLLNALVIYFHNSILIALIIIFYLDLSMTYILFFPNLFIVCFLIFNLNIILGFLGARYRDIEPFIASIMPIMFFLTPVMYKAKSFGDYLWLQYFNPFYYLLTFVRDPLLGQAPNIIVSVVTLSVCALSIIFSTYLTHRYKGRLFFWL